MILIEGTGASLKSLRLTFTFRLVGIFRQMDWQFGTLTRLAMDQRGELRQYFTELEWVSDIYISY